VNWTFDRHAAVPAWRLDGADSSLVLAFSTRLGGVSEQPRDSLDLGSSTAGARDDVHENRRRLLESLRLDPAALVTAGQVHGVTLCSVSHPGHVPECDALLTRSRGLAVAVATADCMPLLLAAPGAVAAVHAGWRGAAAGLPGAALRAFCAAAAISPDAVHVALGPCIRACCYEVGPDVAGAFPPSTVRRRHGRFHLDLPAVALQQLRDAGLPAPRFHDLGVCTACESELCFSYRRDGGNTGRLWGVAALRLEGAASAGDDGSAL